MITVKFTAEGTLPLLLHSSAGMNPRHPVKTAMAPIAGRRGKSKTELIMASMGFADWLASGIWMKEGKVFLDDETLKQEGYEQPALPTEYFFRSFEEAAKATRSGKRVKQGITAETLMTPIEYDGPKTAEEMWEDYRYADVRSVVVQRNRIMRTRVRIPEGWQCSFLLSVDESVISVSELELIAADAGKRIGVGDFRPKFGRYKIIDMIY